MQKIFTTILWLIASLLSYGQSQQETDFNKGVDLLKKGSYKEAIKTFSEIIPKASDTELKKLCYIYRAFSYNELSDFKKSIADFDTAIVIDENDIATYIDRGKTKGYMNDFDGAQKDFQLVLTKDTTSEQAQAALYYLGLIAYQQKEFSKAIHFYNKFIILVPDNAEVYFNRGAAKGMLIPADLEGSIKDYDKAIQIMPNYTEAFANRGIAKINLLTTRGNIQPSKKQTTDACSDLKKARSLGDRTVEDMIFVYCDKK
jgi:tetratricopeptide (TPR) repeat protein